MVYVLKMYISTHKQAMLFINKTREIHHIATLILALFGGLAIKYSFSEKYVFSGPLTFWKTQKSETIVPLKDNPTTYKFSYFLVIFLFAVHTNSIYLFQSKNNWHFLVNFDHLVLGIVSHNWKPQSVNKNTALLKFILIIGIWEQIKFINGFIVNQCMSTSC